MSYRKTKLDANHSQIVQHLRAKGVWVWETASAGQITDLIVQKGRGDLAFLEIKVRGSKAKWTAKQLMFISECPAPVGIAYDENEAFLFARNPVNYSLSQLQKDAIGAMLKFNPKKYYQPSEVEECLDGR